MSATVFVAITCLCQKSQKLYVLQLLNEYSHQSFITVTVHSSLGWVSGKMLVNTARERVRMILNMDKNELGRGHIKRINQITFIVHFPYVRSSSGILERSRVFKSGEMHNFIWQDKFNERCQSLSHISLLEENITCIAVVITLILLFTGFTMFYSSPTWSFMVMIGSLGIAIFNIYIHRQGTVEQETRDAFIRDGEISSLVWTFVPPFKPVSLLRKDSGGMWYMMDYIDMVGHWLNASYSK